MENRINYFILLDLAPTNNIEDIKNAINNKKAQWQSDTRNPRKQIAARENITKLPDIEKVMFDDSLRLIEIEDAKKASEKSSIALKNELLLLQAKGFILASEIEGLLSRYPGIKKEDLVRDISVEIKKENGEKTDINSSITEEQKRQLESYFSSLSIDDMSLYNFYKVSKDTDLSELADKKIQFILQKGQKDIRDEIEQKIAGLTKTIFKDNKSGYDNFLRGNRFIKLNNYIRASVSNNRIGPEAFFQLMNIADNEYGMKPQNFKKYVENNARDNNYEIDPSISMLFIMQEMGFSNKTQDDNKTTSREQSTQNIDNIQKKEDNLIDESEKIKIEKYIEDSRNYIDGVFKNFTNNKKVIMDKKAEKEADFVSTKEMYIFVLISLLIAAVNISIVQTLHPRVQTIAFLNSGIAVLFSVYIYALNVWHKKIDAIYKECESLFSKSESAFSAFKNFDVSLFFNNNQAVFDEFKQIMDTAANASNQLVISGQNYLKKVKLYPPAKYKNLGILFIVGLEMIIITFKFLIRNITIWKDGAIIV